MSKAPFSWDYDNNGKIDYSDMLVSFDKNKDGLLDKSELSLLVQQLSSQLDYSNTLLRQVCNDIYHINTSMQSYNIFRYLGARAGRKPTISSTREQIQGRDHQVHNERA